MSAIQDDFILNSGNFPHTRPNPVSIDWAANEPESSELETFIATHLGYSLLLNARTRMI